jgi:hypothetical protein
MSFHSNKLAWPSSSSPRYASEPDLATEKRKTGSDHDHTKLRILLSVHLALHTRACVIVCVTEFPAIVVVAAAVSIVSLQRVRLARRVIVHRLDVRLLFAIQGHPGSVREERVVSDLHLLECAMGASLVLDQRDVLPRAHAVDLGACRCSLLDLLLQVLQNLVPLTTQFSTVRCVLYIIIRNIRSILIGNSGAF